MVILGTAWSKVKERIGSGGWSRPRREPRRPLPPQRPAVPGRASRVPTPARPSPVPRVPQRPARPEAAPPPADAPAGLPAGRRTTPPWGREGVGGTEGFGSEGVRSEGFGTEGIRSEGFGSEGVGSEGLPAEGVRASVVHRAPLSTLRLGERPVEGGALAGTAAGPDVDPGRWAALLSTREGLAQALLLAEVLGKPRALRPYGRK